MIILSIALSLALTLPQDASFAAARSAADSVVAFVDVTVIPMDRERVLEHHTVVVRGDRIIAVTPASQARLPAGARRVDGRGKFLVPGVAEMHAHLLPQATTELNERLLFLFAANGVTTVRGMLGAPAHLELRARAARREIVSPTIYSSSPSLNGNSASDWMSARALVIAHKQAGYDFLKIHPGIQREVFDSLAAAAQRAGIRYSGHVPADVGLARALALRYASIDHLDGYVEYLARATPADAPGFFGINLTARVDESRIAEAVRLTRAAGTWMVPTQSLMEAFLSRAAPEELAARPEMRYMPPAMVAQWTQQLRSFQSQAGVSAETAARFLAIRRALIRDLHRGGVGILLGSDAPQVMMVPGFSVHAELRSYVQAGLTPYQALETGTRNVAAFFGALDEFGTVQVGRRADLVLLEANPLVDIANFGRQAGVMVRGRWLPRAEIDARLRSYASPT